MIAYLANEFPCSVEPYIVEEIHELRRRGLQVMMCSVKRPRSYAGGAEVEAEAVLYLYPLRAALVFRALVELCRRDLVGVLIRIFVQGNESIARRLRALAHTFLGVYYSVLLKDREVEHIHVHHGYFAAWIAMIAARRLGVSHSMTLHGSDLLLHGAYLDVKLKSCKTCFTVSEFNRNFVLKRYPEIPSNKVVVNRMGVPRPSLELSSFPAQGNLRMLAVGRLHPVKDHAFLVRACRMLKDRGRQFTCQIVGDGPERDRLGQMVRNLGLENEIEFTGQMPRRELERCYSNSELVVLTSRSEGVPLVLMEAMAHRKLVLAPAITGIPELVIHGKTGFLYSPGSIRDFVRSVELVMRSSREMETIRRSAREQVERNFNREKNLASFSELFIAQFAPREEVRDENIILQQI